MNFSRLKMLLVGGDDAPDSLKRSFCLALGVSVLAAWAFSLGIRLMELEGWSTPEFFADGVRLLSTHDGYAYLAGVNGTSRFVLDPLTSLLGVLHSLTGISLDTLGFWMCPVMAALAGAPACLAAARIGRVEAGAVAGLVSATCFGFYIRTRLGYFDNDLLTLFLAIGTSTAFLLWLWPQCRGGWLPRKDEGSETYPLHLALTGALLVGLFIDFYVWFYPSGRPIVLSVYGVAAVVGLVLARPGNRTGILMGLAVAFCCLQFGWWIAAPAAALIAVAKSRPEALRAHQAGAICAAVVLAGLAIVYMLPYAEYVFNLFMTYLSPFEAEGIGTASQAGVSLPSSVGSVREASKTGAAELGMLVAGHNAMLVFGGVGFLYALVRRPLLILFVPLAGLAVASIWLGTRFTMYGGVVFGLGAGLLVAELLRIITSRRVVQWAGQAALFVLFLYLFTLPLESIRPSAVLSPGYALALQDLKDIAGKKAILWQWWDQGYAAQYYAGRDTFGDGGRHSGDWLYPLGLAHASTSARQSSQVMKYFGSQWAEQYALDRDSGEPPYPPAKLEFRAVQPMKGLNALGPRKAMDFIEGLRTNTLETTTPAPEQYITVAWDNFHFMNWISYYGSWDLVEGTGYRGTKKAVPGGRVDARRGIAMNAAGRKAKLSELIMVTRDGKIRTRSWMRFGAPYCIANQMTGEMYILDSRQYNSMMVQLLLGDPSDFEPHFSLVVDRAPWARVYRVK